MTLLELYHKLGDILISDSELKDKTVFVLDHGMEFPLMSIYRSDNEDRGAVFGPMLSDYGIAQDLSEKIN